MSGADPHYSYSVYRRPEIAEGFDKLRFSGAIGELVASRQEQVVRGFLDGRVADRRILDVGVGTGRLALPLAAAGARVVGIDASPLMLGQVVQKDDGHRRVGLAAGDAHHLPFADRRFDVVLCFRVLMHVVDWRAALRELCRVAGSELVIDVPPRLSVATLDPIVKRALGSDEQLYRTFSLGEVRRELARNGFDVERVHRDWVLPFALHRKLRSARFTRLAEGALRAIGLSRLFGSPATFHAVRRDRPRVLMLSPQPFFSSRGTPFSVRHRLEALSSLGYETDLVTYHVGADVDIPGVSIHRIPALPGVHRVRIGPSLVKLPLDALLAVKALGLILRRRYHLVQGHEEAGLIGVVLGWLRGVPHLYDMHSSLPEQLDNYGFTRSRFLIGLMQAVERVMLRGSAAVIVVCPYLVDLVRARAPRTPVVLIENRPPEDLVAPGAESPEARAVLAGLEGRPVVLYTGTLEINQGLDMLVEGMRVVAARVPDARLVLVGGEAAQVRALEEIAERAGVRDRVVFTGQRPVEDMPAFMAAAAVLVSARCRGKNSPLKLYSYLRWAKPIVATDLYTHTQVLDAETALLVEPTAAGLGEGIARLLEDPALAERLASGAGRRYADRYTWERFVELTQHATVLTLHGGRPSDGDSGPLNPRADGAGPDVRGWGGGREAAATDRDEVEATRVVAST